MLPDNCRNSDLHRKIQKYGAGIIFAPEIEIHAVYNQNNKMTHWNHTFFKLNVANLTQFDKVVFLDADMIVLKNLDHLFSYSSISATTGGKAAHPEWTEFNSGIMVIEPAVALYNKLIDCIVPAIERKTAQNLGYGDQDVFNQCFPDWNNHPELNFGEQYNVEHCFIDNYMKASNTNNFDDIYVLHFIGAQKIWNKNVIQLLRMFHGLIHDKKYYEIRACLLYLKYLLF